MKQEDKELALKDLCGRLPYGVKCAYFNTKDEIKVGELLAVWCKEKRIFIDKLSIDYDGGDCIGIIPYLFPLSRMTPKQKAELSMLVVGEEDLFKSFLIEVEFYHKHHIDYRGLIPKGLAIDATGLNIY